MWRDFRGSGLPGAGRLFLDSGSSQKPGGTGVPFDWHEAANAVKELSRHQKVVVGVD